MAEPLKNSFGPDIPRKIASMITGQYRRFDTKEFLRRTLDGYEELELTQRGRQIAHAMHAYLPPDFERSAKILIKSLGPELEGAENFGMTSFLYLPHVFYAAEYGLDDFEAAMDLQYELTKRFTAEFSIRSYLIQYPKQTLAVLRKWSTDSNLHVRRLVSEGTRPRLPWAQRLPAFQKDPRSVLKLLEVLKDDTELYVRRSVANNLNDIGKDNPDVLIRTARKWLKNATPEREWLVRHGLRSLIKAGDPAALELLGYGDRPEVTFDGIAITPSSARIGGAIRIEFHLASMTARGQSLLVDFRLHYIKANGESSPKVFKLKTVELAGRETVELSKKISLKQMSTRQHYPGTHVVDVMVNGVVFPLGEFELSR